jgi:hypothetical protein
MMLVVNKLMLANRRLTFPLGFGRRFGGPFQAQRSLAAGVGENLRSPKPWSAPDCAAGVEGIRFRHEASGN